MLGQGRSLVDVLYQRFTVNHGIWPMCRDGFSAKDRWYPIAYAPFCRSLLQDHANARQKSHAARRGVNNRS